MTSRKRPAVPTLSMEVHPGLEGSPESSRPGLVVLFSKAYRHLPAAYVFQRETLTLGRDASCDIVLLDASASNVHATIRLEKGLWLLSDEGSRNGTYVDGERISHPVVLHDDQVLLIGDTMFKFVPSEAEGYRDFRIDGARLNETAEEAHERFRSPLVGGFQMHRIDTLLGRLAPGKMTVLMQGETGSGKDVAAARIHALSGRAGEYRTLNCAAISPALIEAELFGHKKGAFTGATEDRVGHIRAADGGTLFLDEIGDMPLDAQAKLLRVLEQGEVIPVGSDQKHKVDVRVVAATHRDLRAWVAKGKFRGDLFARLSSRPVVIPPLRDRKEDIFRLTWRFAHKHGAPLCEPSPAFMAPLLHYDFPYNVRELRDAVENSVLLSDGRLDTPRHLPEVIRAALPPAESPRRSAVRTRDERTTDQGVLHAAEAEADESEAQGATPPEADIRAAMDRNNGNLRLVGDVFNRSRGSVNRWLRHYGIDPNVYRRRR